MEGLKTLLQVCCDYIPEIIPVARALEAKIITKGEGGSAWYDRMNDLRAALHIAVYQIDRGSRLGVGWTVGTATDWIWARSHFTV